MLQIKSPSEQPKSPHPLFNLGFRIFFSAAAVFAVLIMALWTFVYTGNTNMDVATINPFYWHAHEMFYGYALAVIAGFLLTAVKTWTGIMMPYGYRLIGIFICWAIARIAWMLVGLGIGNNKVWFAIALVSDLAFIVWMSGAIIKAVLAVKQYRQMGIIAKLVLLTIGNMLCYWGIYSGDMNYVRIGDYLGLYLVLGIVLTIGRRVVPFFIERGLSHQSESAITVKNSKVLDFLSLVSFLAFMIVDIFYPNKYLITISAAFVAVVNLIRLFGWHHRGIWQKPLLWSLFLSFLGMGLSFVMFAVQPWLDFSHSLAVHALALSGIGLITIAMMSRVSLGHTGRSIHQPPSSLPIMFYLMLAALLFRVIMPLLFIEQYALWLMVAQTAWIASFALFCFVYIPILAAPRTDKLFG